jgi:hypothetical protein
MRFGHRFGDWLGHRFGDWLSHRFGDCLFTAGPRLQGIYLALKSSSANAAVLKEKKQRNATHLI